MPFNLDGVDFSAHSPGTPGSAALLAEGKRFVCIYLSDASDWRVLSPDELDELVNGGVDIVANFEADVETWRGGFQTGVAHARFAQEHLVRLGLPPSMPIYFSVDYDASPSDQAVIDDYFHGVAQVIGLDRTGVYGGFYVVMRCHDNGTARWYWQTTAWSGGQWHSACHIRQVAYSHNINGVDCDDDVAMQDTYGQASAFRSPPIVPVSTTTTPPPVPTTPSPYAKRYPPPSFKGKDVIQDEHVFRAIDRKVTTIRTTPRLQTASANAKEVGPPIAQGTSFVIKWLVKNAGGTYLVTPAGTRIHAEDCTPLISFEDNAP